MNEQANADGRGRIVVISGCMFAGKTSRLIQRLQAAADEGRRVRAFKHADDVRYAQTALATHDNKQFPAKAIDSPAAFERQARDAEVLGLDEAHFFGPGLTDACVRLRDAGKTIILVGLDNDIWGRPLPPFDRLKSVADAVEILHAPCSVCSEPAIFSQRMTPIIDGNIVGGLEAYEVRCAACFTPHDSPAPAYDGA